MLNAMEKNADKFCFYSIFFTQPDYIFQSIDRLIDLP
jgi:hypothetical protein